MTSPPIPALTLLATAASEASREIARAPAAVRNRAIRRIADAVVENTHAILTANRIDVTAARSGGMSPALLDRLTLTRERLVRIAEDARRVAELPDPLEGRSDEQVLESGLRLHQRRIPLGVLGVIYEARPNVTVDVGVLALKSGNAALLRGGSETLASNKAIAEVMSQALSYEGLPPEAISMVTDPDRNLVLELLHLDALVDVIIPRGGAGLHEFCRANSRIPVLTGGIGICHLYVDESADLARAVEVIHNAKTQRPSVCNALDTLLVHEGIADSFLPVVADRLRDADVCLRVDAEAARILGVVPETTQATASSATGGSATQRLASRSALESDGPPEGLLLAGPGDFDTEWLALTLGVRIVEGLDGALDHIRHHSTRHSDGILTETEDHAARFVNEVDSAAVYVNASTRFTDGSQFGLGAEVAVSTQKLHARGPVGLEALTTYKWVGIGDYHVRG